MKLLSLFLALGFYAGQIRAASASKLSGTPSASAPEGSAGGTASAAAPAAQPVPPPSSPAKLSASELEKLVMPIALHPDPLISIILPASVYPLEVVQAARFVRDTNNLPKIDAQPWDDNVKAVAKFPDLIAKMDADLDWTMRLGQAFLDQPKELMDTIHSLRAKAQSAGTLRTTEQQIVTVTNVIVLQTNYSQVISVTNEVVQVAPANPQVVYVPTYPPTVYYPPPTYVYNPYAPLVTFGMGVAVGVWIGENHCDWHGGGVYNDIDVNRDVNRNVNRDVNRDGNLKQGQRGTTQQKWQPDQSRMNKSGAPSASNRDARGWSSGATQPGAGTRPGSSGGRPSTGTAGTRPSAPTASTRPSGGAPGSATRPSSPAGATRPSATPSPSRQAASPSSARSSGGSAFSGMNSGSSARDYSNRGATSRSGGYSGGGAARGGGGRGGRR